MRSAASSALPSMGVVLRSTTVINEPDSADGRGERLENLQTLRHELGLETRDTRHVAPGWASLLTMPAPTGSPTRVNTIGTLFVASFAACVAGLLAREDQVDPDLDEGLGGGGIASSFPR